MNLRLCFPTLSEQQRLQIARRCFRNIARSGLDRSVLSKGEASTVELYVKVQGLEHLQAAAGKPLILIAPHFVGLDAGGIRFNTLMRGISIYSKQTNAVWDAWFLRARQRFNDPVLVPRQGADMRTVMRSVKNGLPLYYLPDMDLGAANSIFVPFFGVPAATIPMVPRMARIIGAQVMMAVTEMTDDGYVLHFEPPWPNFPGESIEADTARMNREIERWVRKVPDQYMWTHRRFKTRPPGLANVYGSFSCGRESMKLRFTKMHGAGNDFVMLNGITQRIELSPEQLRQLADRRFGIGADQILLVEKASEPELDFRYRIFNSDGGEVEQCGNGARCFVKFVHDEGLTSKPAIRVQTLAGIIEPRLQESGEVTVDMGVPRFDPATAGFDSSGLKAIVEHEQPLWPLDVGNTVAVAVLSMGNPHAVQTVRDVETAAVTTDGPLLERHHRFRERVNAGFMQIVDRHCIRLRVWERGAGETLACGTGACAAVVSGIRRGLLDTPVRVIARGGELKIEWRGCLDTAQPVLMTGASMTVFKGEIDI